MTYEDVSKGCNRSAYAIYSYYNDISLLGDDLTVSAY
jgi:hypothetical protein